MNNFSLKTSVIASLLIALSAFIVPASAHASIFSDSFFKGKIDASKGNIFQNRDNRNQLLEKMKTEKQVKPLTPEERQAVLFQQLTVSTLNFQNIHDRLEIRAETEATSGQDISNVNLYLSYAANEISYASSTIAAITASSTATTTPPYDARADILNLADTLNSVKINLQQALDALEQN